ncbi:MAG: hypothetical protein JWM68_229 [Verrucomicrobiales bacterium]|nr:hypothetical protein [Verrucomicrobiales bacterium]
MKKSITLFFLAFVFAACGQFTTNVGTPRALTNYSFRTNSATNRALSNVGFANYLDTNVVAFASRAGLTNSGDFKAVIALNSLVRQLKAANLWTNFYALYPFCGSTSNSMAENLVATNYAITWRGTNTFNAYGVHSDGSSGYGDSGFNPSTVGVLTNSFHLYSWVSGTNQEAYAAAAVISATTTNLPSQVRTTRLARDHDLSTFLVSSTNGDTGYLSDYGYFGGNLIGAISGTNTFFAYDGLYKSNSIPAPVFFPNTNLFILADTTPNTGVARTFLPSAESVRAASIGRGMTTNQMATYFAIMNRYQRLLSRDTP